MAPITFLTHHFKKNHPLIPTELGLGNTALNSLGSKQPIPIMEQMIQQQKEACL